MLDVPARLSARVRALGGGSGRKTDDADAFAVAVAGLRARELQVVRPDDTVEILRMLSTRRQEVVALRIATVNRLHDVLCQLIPGGAKRHLSATKARPLLSAVRPRDAVGKARKQLALDYLGELERLDARLKELKKSIAQVLAEHPTTLLRDQRGRTDQRREDPRRDRRRPPVPQPAPLRQLHRHRTGRRVVAETTTGTGSTAAATADSTTPCTSPPSSSTACPARAGLLPAQARPGQDPPRSAALPQTATLRRRLPPPRRRPGSSEPGRTSGGVSSIQRG